MGNKSNHPSSYILYLSDKARNQNPNCFVVIKDLLVLFIWINPHIPGNYITPSADLWAEPWTHPASYRDTELTRAAPSSADTQVLWIMCSKRGSAIFIFFTGYHSETVCQQQQVSYQWHRPVHPGCGAYTPLKPCTTLLWTENPRNTRLWRERQTEVLHLF